MAVLTELRCDQVEIKLEGVMPNKHERTSSVFGPYEFFPQFFGSRFVRAPGTEKACGGTRCGGKASEHVPVAPASGVVGGFFGGRGQAAEPQDG
eukprot:3443025-Rhodomonas_salina.2